MIGMDKHIKELAYKFTGQGVAMLHSEWEHGKGVENVISGDILGIIYCISCLISRISEKTGTTFDETVEAIVGLHNPEKATAVVDGDVADADPDFYENKIRAEIEAKIEKKYENLIAKLNARINSLERDIASDASVIASIKLKMAEERKQAYKENYTLQREIRGKEAEVRKLLAKLADYNGFE